MAAKTQASDRINPFYKTSEPGKELQLLNQDDATLKQNDIEVKGTLQIIQEWSPMRLHWEFTGDGLNAFTFGEVELGWKKVTAKGRLFSKGRNRVAGYLAGQIELGSDHKLDRVTFHLPNYPNFFGDDDFRDEIISATSKTSIRWHEVVLELDDWKIRLQGYHDISAILQKGRASQKVVLTGVGEIRKANESQFKKKEVKPILEALRIFLSFAFAEWSPPLLVVGSNKVAEKSCQFWRNYDVSASAYLRGWLDVYHGKHLVDAFPGFMDRWSRENWQEPLELAVTWLIEASRRSGGTEGAIAFGQIPLEMLAWLIFVDDRMIVDENEFDKLSAASKLQMLLAHCGIPFEVPPSLLTLSKIATELQMTGPQIATKVRNTIIHPNRKNRNVLQGWQDDPKLKKHSISINDIRWETQALFKWYITLVLLSLIGYSGKYSNRLKSHKPGDVESVPWSDA